jgi:hypothetical protein
MCNLAEAPSRLAAAALLSKQADKSSRSRLPIGKKCTRICRSATADIQCALEQGCAHVPPSFMQKVLAWSTGFLPA